jgi:hypothetical protein
MIHYALALRGCRLFAANDPESIEMCRLVSALGRRPITLCAMQAIIRTIGMATLAELELERDRERRSLRDAEPTLGSFRHVTTLSQPQLRHSPALGIPLRARDCGHVRSRSGVVRRGLSASNDRTLEDKAPQQFPGRCGTRGGRGRHRADCSVPGPINRSHS